VHLNVAASAKFQFEPLPAVRFYGTKRRLRGTNDSALKRSSISPLMWALKRTPRELKPVCFGNRRLCLSTRQNQAF
jgi:hypothetical protein